MHPDKTRSSSFVGNGYVEPNLLLVPTVVTTASTSEEQPVCVADQAVLKALKTDMVRYKRLLYMIGFLRPPATTSG